MGVALDHAQMAKSRKVGAEGQSTGSSEQF
jgi:hypothetical protein